MRVIGWIMCMLGASLAVHLARVAHRAPVHERVRGLTTRQPWRLPAWPRDRLERALLAAEVHADPERVVLAWMGAVGVGAAMAFVLAPPLALGAAVAGIAAAPVSLAIARTRHRARLAVAIPDALERIAGDLRAGATVGSAINRLAAGPHPLAAHLERVEARTQLGLSLVDALDRWSTDDTTPGVRAASGALALAVDVGGNAAAALEGLGRSLRDRQTVIGEADAQSAQARLSAVVVGGAPLAYLVFSSLVDGRALHVLLATNAGRLCLLVGLALEGAAFLVMRQLLRNEESL